MQKFLKLTFIGTVTGLLNGFFGSGGGAVVVPFMEQFAKVPAKRAHATAVGIILPLCVISSAVYFIKGESQINFLALAAVSCGGLLGGFLGAKCLAKISVPWLHKLFGCAMLVVGIKMLWS